ncbi:transcription termination/antitermination protein NusA [Candidatus Curtissbacteria bacterium]|nr:transcription termination/antitermination protein NusA [Candidatus Curtissbacteria bacterium]
MAIQSRSEFASALNQVCSERGIEPEVVIDSIKQAILAAYRKDYGEPEGIEVDLDANSGEVKLHKYKKDVTPAGFGRIAAQTAKQVILQRIREAEKNAILEEYSSKINTIVSGVVQRISGPVITVNLGKAEAIMPPQEQGRTEKYFVNQRLKFYVVGIKEGTRGEEIIVSRSDNGLLEGLFKQEVPEIASGAVEVKAIAREAGSRSKIAVASGQLGVDPVGSCVGQKGVRVQAVINELNDEKIDVIAYQEDLGEFIKAALSPAKELQVKIEEETKTAEVTAPDDQLSLAIGKEGQNVRLAAKLTGYKIDIRGTSGTPREVEQREKSAVEEAKKALGVTDEEPKAEGTTEESSATDDSQSTQAVPDPNIAANPDLDPVQPEDAAVLKSREEEADASDKEPLIADSEEKKEEAEAEKVAENIQAADVTKDSDPNATIDKVDETVSTDGENS